ncbi:MAG: septal ring lytic transglycosylase RlpA family protein [Gammaproteobacteria bacterium]|nr:septal ring lytic transglycosylase RlpA family protein [Gammaproteobacteria bacterium]
MQPEQRRSQRPGRPYGPTPALKPGTGLRRGLRTAAAICVISVLLGACGIVAERDAAPRRDIDVADIRDAVPRREARSKYGNPSSYKVLGKRYYTLDSSEGFVERGVASWYGTKFHGRRTSSGETYDMYRMTAAHKSLPLPTYVEVTNLENKRRAVLKVNDRGPFHDNRIIDLSYAAALKLGVVDKGTAFVEVRALNPERNTPPRRAAAPEPPSPAPPAAASAPASAPAVSVSASPGNGLYLQIGAFSDRRNAELLQRQVADRLGRAVRVAQSAAAGRPVYRVQVGPLVSVELADQVVARLAGIGIQDHHFMVN